MVTIIITYVDEHAYLAEAVQSALAQHLDEIELILVCNLPSLPEGYHPFPDLSINKFIHEPTRGSAYARNAGLRHASGDWIQFLDVDDLLLPYKIAHQLGHAQSGAIVSPHVYKYFDGTMQPSKWVPDDIWIGMLNSGLGSTSSMLWHRETLNKVGGWNPSNLAHQEYELLFRIASSGYPVTPVDNRETIIRERAGGSITQQTKPIRAKEGIDTRSKMWDYLIQQGLVTPARKNAFLQYIFRHLRGYYRQDKVDALVLYKHFFAGEKFTPEKIGIPCYTFLFKSMGFNATERLFTFYANAREKYLPFLPINI